MQPTQQRLPTPAELQMGKGQSMCKCPWQIGQNEILAEIELLVRAED